MPSGIVVQQQPGSISPFMQDFLRKREALQPAKSALMQTTEDAANIRFQADNNYALALEKHSSLIEKATIRGDTALNNLDSIDAVPEIVGSFLSLFDNDYSRRVQRRNLQREQLEISRAQTGLQTAEQRRALLINSAEFEKQTAREVLQFNRQDILDDVALFDMGIKVEKDIRRKQVEFAQDKTLLELQGFLRDPRAVPPELKGKTGLIELIATTKRAAAANVSVVEFNLSVAKLVADKRDFINIFDSIEEIDNFDGSFPEGVSNFDLQVRKEQFAVIANSLEVMQLAIAAKNQGVLDAAKKRMFAAMDSNALKQGLSEARKNNGALIVGTVPISAREFQTALVAAVKREKEEEAVLSQNSIAISNVQGNILADTVIMSQFANLYDPTNPNADDSAMPIDVLADLANMTSRINNQKKRVAEAVTSGSPNADATVAVLNDYLEDRKAFYRKEVEDRVENDFSDQSKRAAREYFLTGRVGKENGRDLIMDVIGDSSLFSMNDIVDGPWTLMTTKAGDILAEKITRIQPSGEGIFATSGGQRASIALETLIIESKFREGVANNARIVAMAVAINQLAEEFRLEEQIPGEASTEMADVFNSLRNARTGLISSRFFTDEGSFDIGSLLTYAAEQTTKLREDGILAPDDNIMDMILDRTRVTVDSVVRGAFAGLYGASIESTIFGNKAINSQIREALDATAATVPASIVEAEAFNAEQDRFIDRTLAMREQRGMDKAPIEQIPPPIAPSVSRKR